MTGKDSTKAIFTADVGRLDDHQPNSNEEGASPMVERVDLR